jgi:diguanylate cyclase (GGDEF) domain
VNFAKSRTFQATLVLVTAVILIGLGSSLVKFKQSIRDIQKNISTTPHEIRYQLHQSIHQVTLLEQEMRLRKQHSLSYDSRSLINRTEQLKYRVINIRGTWDALDTNLDKSHVRAEIGEFEEQILTLESLLKNAFKNEITFMPKVAQQILKLKFANTQMFASGSKFLRLHTENYVKKLSTIATAINALIVVFISMLLILSYSLIVIFKQRNTLNRLSTEDPLTKLYNRRQFNLHLCKLVDRYNNSRSPLTLVVFDVDFFKMFNDNRGHIAGDKALTQIAERLIALNSETLGLDAYRVGGEEFACLYCGLDYSDSLALAEDIRKTIEKLKIPHETSDISNCITVSIGVVNANQFEHATSDTMYSAADQALYEAKKRGRNCSYQYNT